MVGRPVFRRKHGRQSVRLTRNGFRLRGQRLHVAKVGEIRLRWSRRLPSVPSSVTVIREPDGRYYASFVVDRPATPLPVCAREVGVDLGLNRLSVTSDGEVIANPRFLRAKQRKLAHAQRALSRTDKGSANRVKARRRVRWCTARSGKRALTTHIRQPSGWSATAKRSTPRTWPCPGSPGPGSLNLFTTPGGPSCCA